MPYVTVEGASLRFDSLAIIRTCLNRIEGRVYQLVNVHRKTLHICRIILTSAAIPVEIHSGKYHFTEILRTTLRSVILRIVLFRGGKEFRVG